MVPVRCPAFFVGEEFSGIPLFGISMPGIVSGIVVGIVTVLLAAGAPANGLQKYLLSQQFQAIHKMMVMYTTQ